MGWLLLCYIHTVVTSPASSDHSARIEISFSLLSYGTRTGNVLNVALEYAESNGSDITS